MAVKRFSNSLISQSGQDKVSNFIAGYSPAIDEMDLIERVTVGAGGAASIEFTSIPGTYQHLQVRLIGRTTWAASGNESVYVRLNGVTSSSYARHDLRADGATVSANAGASQTFMMLGFIPRDNVTASVYGAAVIDIFDYASTSKNTTARSLTGSDANGSGTVSIMSSLYNSTNAVSSILLYPESFNFKQHSTASLYGVIG